MEDQLNWPCKVKVQSGSIGGEPKYIWIDAIVIRKIDNYQYVLRQADGDALYYVKPEEIWMSLYDFKLLIDEQI